MNDEELLISLRGYIDTQLLTNRLVQDSAAHRLLEEVYDQLQSIRDI